MIKEIPKNLTSYDLLKTLAMVLMIVDHLGYYFFPDLLWFRAFGRLSAPIWLFLVGYSRSRDFSTRMWVSIFVLTLSSYVVGLPILPLTILVTILIARAILDPLMQAIRKTPQILYPVCTVLFLMTIPTFPLFEYGSVVMMIVMLGYLVRHKDEVPFRKDQIFTFAIVAAASHVFYETMVFFNFDKIQTGLVAIGTLSLLTALLRFRPIEYPDLTARLPVAVTWILQLCGRRSLELYVIHIVLFRFVALALGYEGFSFLNFHIF